MAASSNSWTMAPWVGRVNRNKLTIILISTLVVLSFHTYFEPPISSRSMDYDPPRKWISVALPAILPDELNQLIIHQSWKTRELPERMAKWAKSWSDCYPNAKYILWTDDMNRELIRRFYPWFLYHYDNFRDNIQRADVVRYFYLFHYGGLYVDLDAECIKPFTDLLSPFRLTFGAMQGEHPDDYTELPEGYTQNSLMYSKRGELMWLDAIYRTLTVSRYRRPEYITGPHILMAAIRDYRNRFPDTNGVKIYPPRYFNPISWIIKNSKHCKDFNEMSDSDLRKCRQAYENKSYVVQYHTQTWGKGKIL